MGGSRRRRAARSPRLERGGEQPDQSTLDELEGEPVLQVVVRPDGKLLETWVPAKPMREAPKSVWDIPRNDVAACVAFYSARKGKITAEEMSVMLRLQDDDTELLELAESWSSS